MKRLTTLALIVVLGVMYAHAIMLNYESRKLLKANHWGCDAIEYQGPTGDNYAVYPSEWKPYTSYSVEWKELTVEWEIE